MTQKTEVIITAKDETRAAIASAQRGLQSLSAAGSRLGQTFASLGVGGGLVGLIGGAGLTTTIKQTIDDLDKLNEAAERIGVTVEDLSALNFAGQLNGLEFEEMTTALTKLSVKMQEAASGSKEAADLFADLGIKVTDSAGKLKSSDAVFAEIAERFASFEDGAAKTALAVDLFGKSGAKLVPVLNGGAAGIKSMRDEAERLGAVIGSDLTKQADEFNDNLLRLSVVSSAAGRALAENLLPSLIQFSSEALIAIKNSDGLFDAFVRYGVMKSLNFKTPTESLAALNKEAQKLEDTISIGRGKTGDDERLRKVQQEIGYYTQLENIKNGTGKPPAAVGGTEPIKRTPAATGGAKSGGGAKSQADDAARLITSLREQVALKEVDLQSTDKMTAAEKEAAKVKYQLEAGILKATGAQREAIFASLDTLATLEKLVTAQEDYRKALESAEGTNTKNRQAMFEQIEAAEKAAELFGLNAAQISVVEQARLADAIAIARQNGASEDQIAVLEEELALREKLSGALIKGEEKSQQQKDAEDAIKAVGEMDEFAKQAARNMETAFADFFMASADGFDDIASNFGKAVQRMIAEAASAQLLKLLFGDMGKTGNIEGIAGKGLSWLADLLPSFDVGTDYVPRDMVAQIHKGERIVPAAQNNQSASAGQPVVQHMNFYGAAEPAQVKRAAAAGARSVLGVANGARRYG